MYSIISNLSLAQVMCDLKLKQKLTKLKHNHSYYIEVEQE